MPDKEKILTEIFEKHHYIGHDEIEKYVLESSWPDVIGEILNSLSDEWINIEEPPEKHGYYAVVLKSPKLEGVSVAEAFWCGDRWDWGVSIRYANHMEISVILWQPLPAPPGDQRCQ